MSGNTSATGGILQPGLPSPIEDVQLTNMMQQTIVGMLGFTPSLVRPRWQPIPAKQPDPSVDWCAIGCVSRTPLDYPYLAMQSDETFQMQRHEEMDWIASFYGPNSDAYAGIMRDGFYVKQNWDLLNSYGIRLLDVRETTHVPTLVNMQYIGQTDLPFTVVRQLNRIYPVLSILRAKGTVEAWIAEEPYSESGLPNGAPLGVFVLGVNTLADPNTEIISTFDTANIT